MELAKTGWKRINTYNMKKGIFILGLFSLLLSCKENKEISSYDPVNWNERSAAISPFDSLEEGSTYLSVYSEIYSQTEHRTHNLTATVSMRNIDTKDTLYVEKAEYFNTHGEPIRIYFEKPIYVAPMETVEIVVDETDMEGGTGANFVFEWAKKRSAPDPLFEGVMISTSGQQGLSFTSRGVRIK